MRLTPRGKVKAPMPFVAPEAAWTPNPGPQTAFLEATVKDVCYGGARGGGKSIALLLDFNRYAGLYRERARGVIFRKTYTELEELIVKGQKYFCHQLGWTYNVQSKTFTAPYGATLLLRYLERMEDAQHYAGHEYPWQGFDEIGNWATPEPLDLLMGSMRSGDGLPTYRRSTCMPGGPGHVWVKERYDPDGPYGIRTYAPNPSRPDLTVETLFIPARLEDNPKVNQSDYEVNLAAISNDALFDAWRWGRWDRVAGAFFDCWNPDTMVVPANTVVIREWDVRWISGDWGFRDDCVIHWHAQDENRKVTTYRELKVKGTTPQELGRLIAKMNDGEPLRAFCFSPDAFAKKTSPRTIADEVSQELILEGLPPATLADNDRMGGWMLMYQLLLSGMWRISSSCKELIKAIPVLQHDPKNSADIDDNPLDHAPDAARYGLKTWLRETRPPHEELVRRYVEKRMPDDRAGQILGRGIPEEIAAADPAELAAYHTRAAMLSRRAESSTQRRFRPKARGYGRPQA